MFISVNNDHIITLVALSLFKETMLTSSITHPEMAQAVEIFSRLDDVIKRKHFPLYRPFVKGIHRSPLDSPHKGRWHGALMFSFICAWKRLIRQARCRWFETPSRSLGRHCNGGRQTTHGSGVITNNFMLYMYIYLKRKANPVWAYLHAAVWISITCYINFPMATPILPVPGALLPRRLPSLASSPHKGPPGTTQDAGGVTR